MSTNPLSKNSAYEATLSQSKLSSIDQLCGKLMTDILCCRPQTAMSHGGENITAWLFMPAYRPFQASFCYVNTMSPQNTIRVKNKMPIDCRKTWKFQEK